MSNVLALPGNAVPSTKPVQPLIDMLRDMVAMAERGELRTFVGVGFMADGCRITVRSEDHVDVCRMLGALAWLQADYVRKHATED